VGYIVVISISLASSTTPSFNISSAQGKMALREEGDCTVLQEWHTLNVELHPKMQCATNVHSSSLGSIEQDFEKQTLLLPQAKHLSTNQKINKIQFKTLNHHNRL
jgi:hypothetical protein